MKFVGVLEAKTHLSRLLDELEETGEPLVITRHGKPVATICGAKRPSAARGVADGDREAAFETGPAPEADPYAEAEAMLKADPGIRERLRAGLMGLSGDKRPQPGPRKLSGPELLEKIKALQAQIEPDPELDAMSWEELKELIRS